MRRSCESQQVRCAAQIARRCPPRPRFAGKSSTMAELTAIYSRPKPNPLSARKSVKLWRRPGSTAPQRAPDSVKSRPRFSAYRDSGQGSRTCENPRVSNLFPGPDCSSLPFRHLCRGRNRFGFLLWGPRSWNDVRPPNQAVWKRRDRAPRRPLDPVSRQRPWSLRSGKGDRFVGQRGSGAGHDASRHHSRVGRIAFASPTELTRRVRRFLTVCGRDVLPANSSQIFAGSRWRSIAGSRRSALRSIFCPEPQRCKPYPI